MKVLLVAINAKYIHSSLAVNSIAAYNREYSEWLETAEYTINNDISRIEADIFKRNPDVVGLSCYIWNYSYVREIVSDISKVLPGTKIWLGGPEVSYNAADRLESEGRVYGIVRGEGEETWKELLAHYVKKSPDLKDILGITYRTEGGFVDNPDRPPILMDDISLCTNEEKDLQNRIIYYEGSRGCPFKCSYCLSSMDCRLRFKSLDKIKKELSYYIEREVPQVKFTDRTFNCNHEYAKSIWRFLIEKDKGITNFHFEVAADLLDEEEIDIIRHMRKGLIQLEIGVQTTNTEALQAIHRHMDFGEVSRVVKALKEAGTLHLHLDLIAGLPHEGYDSFRKSFNDVYSLRPHELQLGFLKVLKGSEMYERSREFGIIYREEPPYEVLSTKDISHGEILKLKAVEEMLSVYYNSRQFDKTLLLLEREYSAPFDLYMDLAQFYEDRGLSDISHSRISRYDHLREFIISRCFKPLKLYDEAMLYDLYARENLKSRPHWAKEQEDHSSFYTDEKNRPYFEAYDGYNAKQIMRMTHMEHFSADFTKWKDSAELDTGEADILFDYKKRDPIDNSAYARAVAL